jgi:hypothetical protein
VKFYEAEEKAHCGMVRGKVSGFIDVPARGFGPA